MSFRTVVITKQSSLSYKNRFLVVKQDVDEKYIHLSEIDTVVVDTPAVSISVYLLKELSDNKIIHSTKVISVIIRIVCHRIQILSLSISVISLK